MSDAAGTPLLATRITPAVTPLFGNNPAFAVLLYSHTDGTASNSAIFYMSNVDEAGSTMPAQWQREYNFAQTYGVNGYTAANVAALAQRIRNDSVATRAYVKFYSVDAPTPINKTNLTAYACAQTALTPADYAACRCTGRRTTAFKKENV